LSFRVLVAEPDSFARARLLSILRQQGAEADAVDCLHSVFAKVVARRYDLVCADHALSKQRMGGLTVGDLLWRHRIEVPLIITGDSDTLEARGHATNSGAVGFASRPYDEPQLGALIHRAMAHSGIRSVPHDVGPESVRIVMYSHDTIGLGHMRRNANIAKEILRMRPDASVLMLVGCPTGLVFDVPPGIDYVKLPSLVKLSREEWRPDRLNISASRARNLRERLIREAIGAFEPNLILVDHMPTGVWNELAGILAGLRHEPHCPDVVLGLRDILDAPEATDRSWRKSGADSAIRELYDEVLVYGTPSHFDTVKVYGLDVLAPGRVSYAGYVTALADPLDIAATHDRLSSGDRPLVLISGGGGRDAFPVIAAALGGLASIPEDRRPAVIVVVGPLMAPNLRAYVRIQSTLLGATYFDYLPDLPACLAVCDFMIGMGGYNSMIEAAAAGVPNLVVPRRGPSTEQMTRAHLFAKHGLAEMLLPEMATAEALGARLAAVTRLGPRTPQLQAEGAKTAAVRILERIDARVADGQFMRIVS
jgi:predicted glycosyltransferase